MLLSALVHSKDFEHFSGTTEPHNGALLLDGERCQEDRDDAILTEGNPIVWMTGNLKDKLSVAALIDQLVFRQPPNRQPAKNEWPRAITERLVCLLALDSDKLEPFRLLDRSL